MTDVRTGQSVRVADLRGKVVLIEPMAIWCSNCRAQQEQVREALASVERPDDVVMISLDVDPNEVAPDLAEYAEQHAFDWHFAVATRDLSRELVQAFDDLVLSPPSTPKIFIAPDGSSELSYGYLPSQDLVHKLNALLP